MVKATNKYTVVSGIIRRIPMALGISFRYYKFLGTNWLSRTNSMLQKIQNHCAPPVKQIWKACLFFLKRSLFSIPIKGHGLPLSKLLNQTSAWMRYNLQSTRLLDSIKVYLYFKGMVYRLFSTFWMLLQTKICPAEIRIATQRPHCDF